MPAVLTGLTTAEAARRLIIDGPNRLPQPRRPSALRQLGQQFTHLLALLRWVASGLALLAGQPPLAAAIVVVIVLNALFAFAQEYRADRSAEQLRSMLPLSARVRRDGQLRVIEASQLVRGDLVVLGSGDRISADLELTASYSLAVDESSSNLFLVAAVVAELLFLAAFLGLPPLARLLGGSAPPAIGWVIAFGAAALVIVVDAVHKLASSRRRRRRAR